MNREGYLAIGQDTPEIWCHHYFLADASQKPQITEALERMYGGDVHVHENSWPGLSGILAAMHMLLAFMYVMSAVFICFVTVQAGSRILDAECRDLGIYKSVGCSVRMLRMSFSLRFGIAAFAGAVPGTIAAVFFTDPLVSAVMRVMGISNFSSHVSAGGLLFPGAAMILLFMAAGYLVSGKMRKEDMSVLTAES